MRNVFGSKGDWSAYNSYLLALMSLGYIVGEIAHFLINTTSREVAQDIEFGDQSCYATDGVDAPSGAVSCEDLEAEAECAAQNHCQWNYNGLGIEYQVLAGPSWVAVYTVCNVIVGVISDNFADSFGRDNIQAVGVLVFSVSCLLMGVSNAYWQLVILRMGIAAGEATCRPTANSMIADMFSPAARGVANGIFSWGVYYGYGLAFVIGIYLTDADILGYGWRASYVISAIPGFIIAVLMFFTVKDPKKRVSLTSSDENGIATSEGGVGVEFQEGLKYIDEDDIDSKRDNAEEDSGKDASKESSSSSISTSSEAKLSKRSRVWSYTKRQAKDFCTAPMLLLLLAACVRHTAGFCWAYNTRLYFQTYYPDFDIGYWLFACSVGGGSFGVFFGGFASDRLAVKLGLHSRLWVLAVCLLISTPFACLTLYLEPPWAFAGGLIPYYFFSETWFAILFTVIVEICSAEFKATSVAVFLFVMNNVGGNLPVIVDPISEALSNYRAAIYIVFPGFVGLSAILFAVASIPLYTNYKKKQKEEQ